MHFTAEGGTSTVKWPTGLQQGGAHVTMSYDSTQALANWHVGTESFLGAQIDNNDATGAGFGSATWTCTYDCNTYGL
jgi:hypothetical protein